ncbi:hypothetical protein CTEN210_00296 [Chaetoceros tenuissimus]|uniref:Leucine-rich repeat domain-containing protein n=1 Tax=Chaetoceros tenuissimus TaxID=426638 RepID=A0AAD3CDJ9_9STRA|nr:hypothetical protein CTEN210_00296 [Chaetoceros tenuissimus]
MRVATVNGLVTLFYDGSRELWNQALDIEWCLVYDVGGRQSPDNWKNWEVSDECKRYKRERLTWQQVIVVDGVTEIPKATFNDCHHIKRVILADTVIRIEQGAFSFCWNLAFIKLSLNLEFIGNDAFEWCELSSVFLPPRCRRIGDYAFSGNVRLEILNVPHDAELGELAVRSTKLLDRSLFDNQSYNREEVNTWLRNIINDDALHKVCCSFYPTLDMILDTMIEKGGPKAFKEENSIGITPSRYLKENPYADVNEKEVIESYILKISGER